MNKLIIRPSSWTLNLTSLIKLSLYFYFSYFSKEVITKKNDYLAILFALFSYTFFIVHFLQYADFTLYSSSKSSLQQGHYIFLYKSSTYILYKSLFYFNFLLKFLNPYLNYLDWLHLLKQLLLNSLVFLISLLFIWIIFCTGTKWIIQKCNIQLI